MRLEEQILDKLSPIEKFAIKAKMYLDWEITDGVENNEVWMDAAYIEAISKTPVYPLGNCIKIDLKRLKAALLAFQRNGANIINLFVGQNEPLVLQMDGKEITYSLAPRVEED